MKGRKALEGSGQDPGERRFRSRQHIGCYSAEAQTYGNCGYSGPALWKSDRGRLVVLVEMDMRMGLFKSNVQFIDSGLSNILAVVDID